MKTRASCSPALRRQPTKSKRNSDLEEISRVLEPKKPPVDSNRSVLISNEEDDNDEDVAATTTSGEELGFKSSKDLVWAKALPNAWWPGWIQKAYRGKFLVLFFDSERSLWCRESEIRPFETDFKVNVGVPKLPPDAIDLALNEYRRRLVSEVACPCQREVSVGGLEVEVENMFQPAHAFKFVRKMAVSPSFEEVDSIGVFRVAAQLNAFRRYAFVKSDSLYEKAMRISEITNVSEENMESTCPEDDKSSCVVPEREHSEEEEGEEERKEEVQEEKQEEPKKEEEEPEEVEPEEVELEVEPDEEEPQEEEPEEEDEEEYILRKFSEQRKSGAGLCKKNDKELREQQHLIERSEASGTHEEPERVEPQEDDEDEYILRRFVEHWSSGSVIHKKNSKEHLKQHMTERSQTIVNEEEELEEVEPEEEEEDDFVLRKLVEQRNSGSVITKKNSKVHLKHHMTKRSQTIANEEEELEQGEPEEEEEDEFVLRKLVEQRNSGSLISKKNSKDNREPHSGRSQTTIIEEEEPEEEEPEEEEEEEYTLRKFVEQRKSSSVICKKNTEELPEKHKPERSQAIIKEVFQPVEVLAFVKRMAVSSWLDDADAANVIRKAAQANAFRRHAFIEHDWIYRDTMRLSESNDDSEANMKSAFLEDDQTCQVIEDVLEDDQAIEEVVKDVKISDEPNDTPFIEQVKEGPETQKEITEDSLHDILKHLHSLALNPFNSGRDETCQKILTYRALVYQNILNLHSPSKDTETRKRRRLSSTSISTQSDLPLVDKVEIEPTQKPHLGPDVANNGPTQISNLWPDAHFQHNKRPRVDSTTEHVGVSYSKSNVEDVERVASEIVDLFRDLTDSKGKSKSHPRPEIKDTKASRSNGEGKDIIDLQKDESNKKQKTDTGPVLDTNKRPKTNTTPINGIHEPKPISIALKHHQNIKPVNTHGVDGKTDNGPNVEETLSPRAVPEVGSGGVGRFCRRNVDKPVVKFDKPVVPPLTMLYSSPLSAVGAPPLSNGKIQTQIQPQPQPQAQRKRESESPTTLHMMFPKNFTPPSKEELVKQFRRFGPMDYSKTKIFFYTGSAQIMFKYHLDAEAALNYARRNKLFFGGANVRYWLNRHENSRSDPTPAPAPAHLPSISNLKSCLKITNPTAERRHLHVKFPTQGPPDISPQMLVLLERCNKVVSSVKSNLGIRDFYSLFTHNYCQVKLDDG